MYMYIFFMKLFLFICKIINKIESTFLYVYNNNSVVKGITDGSCYIIKYIYCSLIFQRIEPYEIYWTSKCWITLPNEYNEIYTLNGREYPDYYLYSDQYFEFIGDLFYTYCEKETQDIDRLNHVFIMKTTDLEENPRYIVSITDTPKPKPIEFYQSNAFFLSIEYKHPEMEYTIDINIGREWLLSGNILFTPTFVLRMLQYQSKRFLFDETYKIRFIDGNINIDEFGYNEYLELTDTGYVIHSNTPMTHSGSDADEDTDPDYVSIEGTVVE